MSVCGIIFSNFGSAPHDETGCALAVAHSGPHQFTCRYGTRWCWETDWECDCETCMKGEPADYCSIYWKAEDAASKGVPA